MTSDHIEEIRAILHANYPGWEGPEDPRFVADEIEYKRAAADKAATRLSRSALTDLITRRRFTEVIERLEEIAKETNLLYRAQPQHGDLNILYSPNLDHEAFADQILDLLHGEEDAPERLGRYAEWVDQRSLPNKWTFPTYFLFLVHPRENLFVKPRSMGRFLKISGADLKLGSSPDRETYERLLEIGREVATEILDDEAADMIPVQSVAWIVGRHGHEMGVQELDDDREHTLQRLLEEFARAFVATEEGVAHLSSYPEIRESARQNFDQILAARDRGQDITDLVLTKLLPHRDVASNRARGAWIHTAPAVAGDVKTWFENAGWVQPEDWPNVSRAILEFVERVVDDPDALESACESFADSEYSKGFQTGMLTPILSALIPDQMILINNKSRAVVNHFLGLKHSQKIVDYPALNTAAHYLINRLRADLSELLPSGVTPHEGFDAFSHWLVALKGYRFGRTQVWKIDVRDRTEWPLWIEGGFAALSEAALGDLTTVKEKDWEERRAKVLEDAGDTSGDRLDEVWTLANDAQEGDLILATGGTDRVLGYGLVVGPYEYQPAAEPQHRIPVSWQNTEPRSISEPGWRGRFHEIDPDRFDKVKALKPLATAEGEAAFSPRAFELLDSIHETPTRDFYSEHQEAFREHVEGPLKDLMTGVAELLPTSMKEVLETEKRLFSRFPKNDYGRGGAWDFYWGAFYPRDGKRISSAQLFMWVDKDRLEYGFTLGEYAEEHFNRFLKNIRRRRDSIVAALQPHIDTDDLVFGVVREGSDVVESGEQGISIEDWLEDLEAKEVSARVMLQRDEVLAMPASELRDRVLRTFQQLFPLVLIATSDDPLSAIAEYWGPEEDEEEIQPEYPLERCAEDTGFDVAVLRSWVNATDRKGQAIFYGPPGTGKTFMAEHLARHMVGGGDGFTDLVQFHPAYAYEDFIQGIRPVTRPDGELEYQMVPGRFLEFCRKAQNRSGICVLIIDEINRANLSRVFGELMYLLEYRDKSIPLSGGGTFRIPRNVRLLGTMNTADRSIALVDHALRRRFAFVPLRPRFEILRAYHDTTGKTVDSLIEKLTQINKAIADPNYHLGITFFLDPELDSNLEAIWRMEIEPYLEEFFFDDAATVERFRWEKIEEELGV